MSERCFCQVKIGRDAAGKSPYSRLSGDWGNGLLGAEYNHQAGEGAEEGVGSSTSRVGSKRIHDSGQLLRQRCGRR